MLKKLWPFLFLAACAADEDSEVSNGNGDKSPSFIQSPNLSLELGGEIAEVNRMLFGKFRDEAEFNDVVLLTQNGVHGFKNGESGWGIGQALSAFTSSANYLFGISSDLTMSDEEVNDLIVGTSEGAYEIYENQAEEDSLSFNRVSGPVNGQLSEVHWISHFHKKQPDDEGNPMKEGFIVGSIGDFDVDAEVFEHDADLNFSPATPVSQLSGFGVQAGIKILAHDVNNSGYTDIIYLTEQNAYFYENDDDDFELNKTLDAELVRASSSPMIDGVLIPNDDTGLLDLLLVSEDGFELYRNKSTEDEFADFEHEPELTIPTVEARVTRLRHAHFNSNLDRDYLLVGREDDHPLLFEASGELNYVDITSNSFLTSELLTEYDDLYVADINGDGELDIIQLNGTEEARAFLNQLDS